MADILNNSIGSRHLAYLRDATSIAYPVFQTAAPSADELHVQEKISVHAKLPGSVVFNRLLIVMLASASEQAIGVTQQNHRIPPLCVFQTLAPHRDIQG